ncbi:MAG: CPBP family intramembrane metalloprotease [Verrucomicrobia bacterium]|nr:CPBP family intramembrane metalloprotease [Verrucomicrobiota bacterium]
MPLEKPWPLDATLRLLAGLFASLSAGWIVASLLGLGPDNKFGAFLVSTLCFHGAMLLLVQVFVWETGTTWTGAFGFNQPDALRALLLAVILTLVVLPCAWLLGQLSAYLMTWFRLEPAVQEAVTTLQSTVEVPQQIYMAGAAVLLVPVAEELLFRGILYPTIKGLGWPRVAFWGTAILFGAVHMTLMTFVPLTFLGLCLTWLYEKTQNLLAPIFAHSLFNLANLLLLVLMPPP